MKQQSAEMVNAMTHGFSLIAQQLTGHMVQTSQLTLDNKPGVPMLQLPQAPLFQFGRVTERSSGSASSAASREDVESARTRQRELDRLQREEEDKARELAQDQKEKEEYTRQQEENERKRREELTKLHEENERKRREEAQLGAANTGGVPKAPPASRRPADGSGEPKNKKTRGPPVSKKERQKSDKLGQQQKTSQFPQAKSPHVNGMKMTWTHP